jgi:hypothetical protein
MDNKGFRIPRATLSQLNEFSSGGFVLFTYDGQGNPCVHSQFDSSKDALALQMFATNWAEAMNELGSKSTMDSILRKDEDDEGDFDEDDIFKPDDDDYDDYEDLI